MRLQRCSVRLLAFSLLAACVAGRDLISNDYLKHPKGIDVVEHMFDKFHEDFDGGDQGCLEPENWKHGVITQVVVNGDFSEMTCYLTASGDVRLDFRGYAGDEVMRFCNDDGLKGVKEFVSAVSDLSVQRIEVLVRPVRKGTGVESALQKMVTNLHKKGVSESSDSQYNDKNGRVEVYKENRYYRDRVVTFWSKDDSSAFMKYDGKLYSVKYRSLRRLFRSLFLIFKTVSSFKVPNPVGGKFPSSPFDLSSDVKPPGVSIRSHSNAPTPGPTSTARSVAGDRIDRFILELSLRPFLQPLSSPAKGLTKSVRP